MKTLILLLAMALMAVTSFAQDFCACYTATTTIKPLFCGRDTDLCFNVNNCMDTPTATITIPPHNPMCMTTPTVTKMLPCCGGGCLAATETVTEPYVCHLNDGYHEIGGRDAPPLTPIPRELTRPTSSFTTIVTPVPVPEKQTPPPDLAAVVERATAPVSPLVTHVPTGSVPTGPLSGPAGPDGGRKTLVQPSLEEQQTQPPGETQPPLVAS